MGVPLRLTLVAALAAIGLFAATQVMAEPPAPTASFTVSPAQPAPGVSANYTSTSTDNDPIDEVAWDFDNDGTFESVDAVAPFAFAHTFPTRGAKTVGIRVTAGGDVTTDTQQVVVNAAPSASFTGPTTALVNQTIEFDAGGTTDDAGLPSSAYDWDYDNDLDFNDDVNDPTPSHAFTTPGAKTVRLRVTDSDGATDIATATVTVTTPANQLPSGTFSWSPTAPVINQDVSFAALGSDPEDGSNVTYAWDFEDADLLFDDADGPSPTHPFGLPAGPKTVRLQVTDTDGGSVVVTRTVTVADPANPSPAAGFRFFPAQPVAGQTVDLVSTSSDPNGFVASQQWDLDNDGQFDDASGATASRVFAAGARVVKLRVRDNQGAEDIETHTIAVRAPVFVSPGPTITPVSLMSPFPTVRIVGQLTRTGARISRLSVKAPAFARVRVRCSGRKRGCPRRSSSARIGAKTKVVRFRRFERRLKANAILEISVSRTGVVGKHTRFRIRRGKAPARRDRCLIPGAKGPKQCPDS